MLGDESARPVLGSYLLIDESEENVAGAVAAG
jgi:hypothetical protein